ncbi:MAG: YccF domain-containing protein [Anaerolineae bacterium]
MSSVVVRGSEENPGCLIQLLWFVFVGWWAGQLWIALAWLLMITIVGIPLGVMMMNKVPQVIALRGETDAVTVTTVGGVTTVRHGGSIPQHNLLLRAIYFVLIGWWLSAVWMEMAYAICLTIIGLPIGLWMFDKVPALVSLRRS